VARRPTLQINVGDPLLARVTGSDELPKLISIKSSGLEYSGKLTPFL
jgi:hypothetical protein